MAEDNKIVVTYLSKDNNFEVSFELGSKDIDNEKYLDKIDLNVEYAYQDEDKFKQLNEDMVKTWEKYKDDKDEVKDKAFKEITHRKDNLLEEAKDRIGLIIVWEKYYFEEYDKNKSLYNVLKGIKK